ncbi:MAG: hypothetical protein B6244_13205 [Candidatus Cloacimonetes bacterium 4572_55]|nr:MAG: hypothetical protein B6244_13205 [Candidatus Cloacimonetes bacterium 4572_55]
MTRREEEKDWGRFTVYGNDEVEEVICKQMRYVADKVIDRFVSENLVALILLGGYGRGEGGVVERQGRLMPHNNFDFCLIFDGVPISKRYQLEAAAHELSIELPKKLGVGCDFSVLDSAYLRDAPPFVIWFDMKYAHKVIIGDSRILESMPERTASDILLADAARLLLNRGTLLAINELIFKQRGENLTVSDKETIIKHTVKGIIGYGDAVLLAKGKYHQSYVEKARRFKSVDLTGVPNKAKLRQLYGTAAEFRFKPDYETYLKKDLLKWRGELVEAFEPIHLWFESVRLGKNLTWEGYLETLSEHREARPVFSSSKQKLKAAIKPFYFFLKNSIKFGPWLNRWQFRHPKDRLLAIFPAVIYPNLPMFYKKQLSKLTGSRDTENMLPIFLRLWGELGDSNFLHVLNKLKLTL